jgi:hypothetical protein
MTGEQHGPAGQAHGTDHRTHRVATRERHPLLDQFVEVWGLQHPVAQRMQAVGAMVVGVKMEDVELASFGGVNHHAEQGEHDGRQ